MTTARTAGSNTGRKRGRVLRRMLRSRWFSAIAVCAMFGSVIMAAFYSNRDAIQGPQGAGLAGAGGLSGTGTGGTVQAGSVKLSPDDPVVRFYQTRIGHVLYAKAGSDDCRRDLFDNPTGAKQAAVPVFCGQDTTADAEAGSPERLKSIMKTFQK